MDHISPNSIKNEDKPQIKKYTNLLTFLSDYFTYRKRLDVGFTYEQWSRELGYQSTAIMYLICKGQRSLTDDSVSKLAQALKLSEPEKKHLMLLAHYQQMRSVEVKSALFDKILEGVDNRETSLEVQNYSKFILSATMPLIRMILAYDDIKGTEAEILEILDISKSQLKDDLKDLEQMGLVNQIQLEGSNEIIWKSTTKALRFPEESAEDIMDLFHLKTMTENAKVIRQRDVFKKLRSLILAIDPNDYKMLEDEVDQFVSRLKHKFAYDHLNNKQLIKVHLQSYSVSKTKK